MSREYNLALIGIGGNLAGQMGSPYGEVAAAIDRISHAGEKVSRQSRFFRTPCFPAGAGPDFVNAAIGVETTRRPSELLALLHEVEMAGGRARHARWEARVIDLDLLALGGQVLPDAAAFRDWADLPLERQMQDAPTDLILPHPRLHERPFVLVPLRDIAPDWRHPVLGRTVAQMCDALPAEDIAEIWPVSR